MNFRNITHFITNFLDAYDISCITKDEVENVVRFEGELSLQSILNDVFMNITVLSYGGLTVEFVINDVEQSIENLKLVNKLNDELTWLKGHITDDNQLVLSHSVIDVVSEESVYSILETLYFEFTDEASLPFIHRLIGETDFHVSTLSNGVTY